MPEQPTPQPSQQPPANNLDSHGKAAQLIGIIGLTLSAIPIVHLLGLVFSIVAVFKAGAVMKRDPQNRPAWAGRTLGWIGIGLNIFYLLISVLWITGILDLLSL